MIAGLGERPAGLEGGLDGRLGLVGREVALGELGQLGGGEPDRLEAPAGVGPVGDRRGVSR
ncbi:hypothetical protein D3C87_2150310 [compost metagenome]